MSKNRGKTGRIYKKQYMSIFIRQNFSHSPKNLVICFKETYVSLLLDTT